MSIDQENATKETYSILSHTKFIHFVRWYPMAIRAVFRWRIPASKVTSNSERRDKT